MLFTCHADKEGLLKHQPRFASFSRSLELIVVAKIFKQTLIISPRLLFSCERSRNLNFPRSSPSSGANGPQTNMSISIKVNTQCLYHLQLRYSMHCTAFVISDPSFCPHHSLRVAKRRKEKVCRLRQIAMRSVNATFYILGHCHCAVQMILNWLSQFTTG